ncbi:4-phosphopantoate--beta-alanine ligase [Methanobrevibacter curvatus]|uniref:4-phosphopantoate--beta-alanine ligase n=1 Tax=Methanobrevibacter curvatus TaxID=49547 RepID=A0A166DFG1_9EURY|nr:4-phosphopantoate--beta-alanine ligase [Methanobrevibacter curvatus]KZX15545.1 hypothetical protein MBCUR_02550 [Methanobrevibacter curvatus]
MIPKNHPRYNSLIEREKIKDAMKKSYLAESGMIAHGRGEAFDYLIEEKTSKTAEMAIKASLAMLLLSENPVISINGNSTALAIDQIIELSKKINAKVELNLFYRTDKRVKIIKELFEKKGFNKLLGTDPYNLKYINGLESPRATASKEGIYSADTILVMLEDGDRTEILAQNGKFIIAIDLNPLSRTAQMANITIVDNITRTIPLMIKISDNLKNKTEKELNKIINDFSNEKNLNDSLELIRGKFK